MLNTLVSIKLLGLPVRRLIEKVFAEANWHSSIGIRTWRSFDCSTNSRMIGVRHRITMSFDVHKVNIPAKEKNSIIPISRLFLDFRAICLNFYAMSLNRFEWSAEMQAYANPKNRTTTVRGTRLDGESSWYGDFGPIRPRSSVL